MTESYHIQIKLLEDSLQRGHLPKKGNKMDHIRDSSCLFCRTQLKPFGVSKLTNKIAFVANKDRLITIHQKPFDFLKKLANEEFVDPEDLMLRILQNMLMTYQALLD